MIALALSLALQQSPWIVDDDGGVGVDFTDLPQAVLAAADGDVLLVRAGTYSHFALSGKGLCILGAGDTTQVVNAGPAGRKTTISAVPALSLACCERMKFAGSGFETGRLEVHGASTRALLAELTVSGPLDDGGAYPALRVDGARVCLFDSRATGGLGFSPSPASGGPGGVALLCENGARVFVAGSSLRGGNGAAGFASSGNGGDAVHVVSLAHVWLATSMLSGGNGAFGATGPLSFGGRGALVEDTFVRLSGAGSAGPASAGVYGGIGLCPPPPGIAALGAAHVLVHALPVMYGFHPFGGCGPFAQTSGFDAAGPLPTLTVAGSALVGGELTFTLKNGAAGEPFVLRMARAADLHPSSLLPPTRATSLGGPLVAGELVVAPAGSITLASGLLSSTGEASVVLPALQLGVPVHVPVLLQAEIEGASGRACFSNPAQVTLRP